MDETQILEMVERVWNRPPPRPSDSKNALAHAIRELDALGHRPAAIEKAAMASKYWTVKAIGWNMSPAPTRPAIFVAPAEEPKGCNPEEFKIGLAAARAALNPQETT